MAFVKYEFRPRIGVVVIICGELQSNGSKCERPVQGRQFPHPVHPLPLRKVRTLEAG